MVDRTPITLVDLEFQAGRLVKIRGQRYQYMSGDDLIFVVGELGRLLNQSDSGVKEFIQDLRRRGYTKYRTTQEVSCEYELTYNQAYYRVRKYWKD